MRKLAAPRLALLAAAALAAGSAQAQLFKCVNSAGRTVYQDSPCADAEKQTSIRAPAAAPAPPPKAEDPKAPAKPAAAAPPAPAGPSAVDMVAGYAVCAERVPNFATKYAANYESWKQRNAAAVDRLATEPDASRLDAKMREDRARPLDQAIAGRCVDVATDLLPPPTAAK